MPLLRQPIAANLDEILKSDFVDLSERERIVQSHNTNMREFSKFAIPATAIGAIDTIAQSVTPETLVDEESVTNFISNLNQPLGEFYSQNREGLQTAGEIPSAFVPIIGAAKLIRSGSYIDKALSMTKKGEALRRFVISSGRTRKDFIDSIDQEAKLFVKNKQLSLNENGDQALFKALRNAKFGAAGDMFKESIAADLAIVAFYNDSDLFFPDELSTLSNFALFAVPDVALTGLAYRFTGTAVKKHLQATFGEDLAKALNEFVLATTKSLSFPGLRGPAAAMEAVQANLARADRDAVSSSVELATSGNQRLQVHRQNLLEQIILMGEDNVFKHGITTSVKLEKTSPVAQNLLHVFESDPSLAAGLRSVELLTPNAQTKIPRALQKRMDDIVARRKELAGMIRQADEGVVVPDIDRIVKEFDELTTEFNALAQIRAPVVAEIDGSITPLAQRKFSILDTPEKMKSTIQQITDGGDRIFKLKQATVNELGMEIGVTSQGKILIAPVKKELEGTVLGGINLTTVIPKTRQALDQELAEGKLLLRDMSLDWHYENGKRGRDVFAQLSPELQQEVKNWTGSSGSSQIRQWFKNGDPKAQELINAYRNAGMHRRLHEIANPDGTITLWRGESKLETANPTNDVVSMAASPNIAKGFAAGDKNLIKRNVPVEDVIMIVGGLGDEAEYIVKGNLRRNKSVAGIAQEAALGTQTFAQRMYTWGLMQESLNKFNPKTMQPVIVHPNSSFMELDFAYQLAKKFPDDEVVQVVKSGSVQKINLDELQWQMAIHKFREYQQLRAVQNGSKVGILKLSDAQLLSDYDVARMVNLPNPTAGGKHPMIEVFDEISPLIGEEIRDLRTFFKDFGEFKAAMVKHVNPGKLGEALHADLKLTGSSLLHNRQPNRAPSVLIGTDNFTGRITRDELDKRIMANKVWQNSVIEAELAKPPQQRKAPLVVAIAEELFNRPDTMKLATRPDYIFEGTAVNKGIIGQQSEVFSGNPVVQAMDRLVDLSNKRALTLTNDIFREHTLKFNNLLSAKNAASLDTFNIAVNSLQHGWKVLDEPVKLDDGLWGFVLDDTWQFNKDQYEKLFGLSFDDVLKSEGRVLMPVRASVAKGDGVMPKPVAVDDMALDGLAAIQDISHKFLDNLNFLRELRHLPAINKKAWHIPAINTRKGVNIYLSDGTGRVHDIVNAPTHGEAVRIASKEVEAAKRDGRNWIMQTEKDVMRYHDTLGDIWSQPKNFAYSEFQTGTSKGKLGTRTIQFGKQQLNTLLEALQSNYQLLTRHTHATIFESELNYTRSFIQANTLEDPAKRAAKSTLHQQYENTVLQRSALNPNGYVGKFFYAVESTADDFFRAAWDKIHAVKQPTAQSMDDEFGRLQNKLQGYNPFKSSLEMLEANENVQVPLSMRKLVTKANGFTTDMVLRVLDFGMPVINFASLVSVTPAVVSALHRGPNESVEAWTRRIGAVGTPIDDSQAIPNTTRMVMEGMRAFFDPDTQRIRKMAAERGYIKQEVAERLNLWTSPHKGWLARNRDEIIKTLSIPTDRSEVLSRDIAFQMMFQIGKKTFGLQDEAAMLFAHTHANKIIGDFRPTNRPQMFQGAAGMPLGLFTTWAVNWLQRVFGDIEAGRLGATFWQAGAQQFLFGAESFPGVNTFMETFMTSYDGKTNVMDAMDQMYGKTATDAFFQGTLASLTGVAFQSRADVSLPAIWTGESPMTAIPSVNVMATLYQGLSEGFKSIRQNGGFNAREMSELISVYGVNGFLRNTFQVLNNAAVDRHGAIINDDIRSFESMIPRLMELKSVREQRKAGELQRDRMQNQIQREHIGRLSKQLRAAVRAGTVDSELVESALMDYYQAGGSPTNFKRYLREQVLTASFEKSSRLLLEAIKQSDEQGQAARLLRLHMDDNL